MSERLTEESGEAQLTLWRGGFHAKTSALPAKARASSTANAPGSGARCDASSESADHVGCSLRTYLLSELEGLTLYSLTWKRSATPAGRSWWVLGRSGLRTGEIESGLLGDWQTPLAAGMTKGVTYQYDRGDKSSPRATLLGQALWPTPNANDAARGADTAAMKRSRGAGGPNLLGAIQDWPTPTRNDGDNDTLPPSQLHWDSTVGAVMRGLQDQASRSTSGKSQDWPTPRASREGAPDSHGKAPIRGVLNAKWVAQLMGYPPDWCDLPSDTIEKLFGATATPSSRKSSKQSGAGL